MSGEYAIFVCLGISAGCIFVDCVRRIIKEDHSMKYVLMFLAALLAGIIWMLIGAIVALEIK